jgi:DNA repair photolyase
LKAITESKTNFGHCINCYNGCEHGCRYCYGMKITHKKYSDWVKSAPRLQLPDLLRKDMELLKQNPEVKAGIKDIMICSITDCYQPLESQHRITRDVIKILIESDLSFTVLTKNTNVLRDIDLFKGYDKCRVGFSVITLDDYFRQLLEPNSSPIPDRCEALETLQTAGVSTYCSVEPIMPDQRSDPIAIVDRLKDSVDLFEFGKWNPNDNSKRLVENILGTVYNEKYYVDVFKNIKTYCAIHSINYCHAGHSEDFLTKYQLEFIPHPTILS